jgi:hypothetical protein
MVRTVKVASLRRETVPVSLQTGTFLSEMAAPVLEMARKSTKIANAAFEKILDTRNSPCYNQFTNGP